MDIDTGAHPEDEAVFFNCLVNLVDRKTAGTEALTFLTVSIAGMVDMVHSLFTVRSDDYADPELWGIRGEVPEDGVLSLCKCTAGYY